MRKKSEAVLNFKHMSFLTDISDAEFYRVLPIIYDCMPRAEKMIGKENIRCYLNAILFMSVVYVPWKKVCDFESVYRFYMTLKKRGYLGILKIALRSPFPFIILKRKKNRAHIYGHVSRRRKCPECPSCSADAMICRGTRRQGSTIVRHYRCSCCGSTALWISTDKNSWWKNKKRPT